MRFSANVKFFFVGWEGEYFVCGVGTWGILSLSDYSSALFFSPLERYKCLLKLFFSPPREEQMSFETNSNSQDEEPEESPINWTDKILRPQEQDDTLCYCVTRPLC